ncbi:bZIP transcription factor 60-like [Punica granatum]|uniref:BZIP domain-containing protein n=2 Tax=Punica granatum TaxID=22663 RepID=A0A218XM52_PUNGR|nr:bZIP transcription factor 60-like [Punica granatum]OWM85984.1 hypothetical protein CDL15_Pgr012234 [Punica granatum]PKI35755.1 hypothetical protein CRG98_043913 [Punica granatum]
MEFVELPDDDLMSQIDLDYFFYDLPDDLSRLGTGVFETPSSDSASLSIDEIENILMKDDEGAAASETGKEVSDGFFADLLVDSPSDGSCDVFDGSGDKDSESGGVGDEQVGAAEAVNDGKNVDDPIAKKRQRQLRNRDAALRSRERKKIYVKDLEMKSKYLERECLRLGRLLQCLAAENQALRFNLQNSNAYGASMTKQESAVLLLESLLLGSLFWFLGIMCLSTLQPLLRLTLDAANAGKKDLETQAPNGARNETNGSYRSSLSLLSIMGRRCKATKTKMKTEFSIPNAPSLLVASSIISF